MQPVKVLFIPTLVSGVTYWRMWNPVNSASRTRAFDGWLLWWQKELTEMHPWQNDILSNEYYARITGEIEAGCLKSDIVVMSMIHTPIGLSTVQGIREVYGKPVVMEIDDNILSCPAYNPAALAYNPNTNVRKTTVQQMRESDALIVSTPYLKEIYSEFNDNIYVLPNSIDFNAWDKLQHRKNKGKITIGWVGGANHNDDLLIIEPAIDYLCNKYPQVEFVFGHGMHPKFRDKKGTRWLRDFIRIDKYPQAIARMSFDIGIAPLVDNAFNRGKSNLRWIEYSALGIPTVASNVGHFAETIHDGSDGMLCDTPEDFIQALESLITDTSKRKCMAKEAKARVFKDFNIDTTVKLYEKAFKEIIERGQVKRIAAGFKDSNFKQPAEVV